MGSFGGGAVLGSGGPVAGTPMGTTDYGSGMMSGMTPGGMAMPGMRMDAPNHQNMYGMQSGRPSQATTNKIQPQDLVKAITEAIDPASWQAQGPNAEIKQLGNWLIVRQTPENQTQIAALLESMSRDPQSTPVRIRVYWLKLSNDEAMHYSVGQEAPSVFHTDLERNPFFVTEVVCMDGQTVHIASGDQLSLIERMISVVAASQSSHEVRISTAHLGTCIELTPRLKDDSSCVLAIRGSFADATIDSEATQAVATITQVPSVQSVNAIAATNFRQTLEVPLSKAVTVNRVTYLPTDSETKQGQLVLVATVQKD